MATITKDEGSPSRAPLPERVQPRSPLLPLAALAAFAALSLTIGEASADARKSGHFVGGYGTHPVQALLRKL